LPRGDMMKARYHAMWKRSPLRTLSWEIGTEMHPKELRSRIQFNDWSKNYDRRLYWPFYLSNRTIIQSITIERGSSILDVGCGTGILLQQLYEKNTGYKLHGIDISAGMVKTARRKLNSSICIIEGSANELPHKDNTFDLITCTTSFHHYAEPEKALGEMNRVLKYGGNLLVLDPFTSGFLRLKICAALNTVFKEADTCFFSKEQMSEMFIRAGFSSIFQKTYLYYKLITIGKKSLMQ
jgi:SAM-dependent methyltransferase